MTQPSDASHNPAQEQPLADRVENRSHRPSSDAFKTFMSSHWQETEAIDYQPDAAASYAAQRRAAVSRQFPTIVWSFQLVHQSTLNDTIIVCHTSIAHLTGLASITNRRLFLDATGGRRHRYMVRNHGQHYFPAACRPDRIPIQHQTGEFGLAQSSP